MPKLLLALDVATTTGFAHGRIGEKPLAGAVKFGGGEPVDDQVWKEALQWLHALMQTIQPDVVALEAPIMSSSAGGGTNPKTQGRLMGLQAVLRTVVYIHKPSPARLIHVQSARKLFIGHGNLPGKDAKARVKRRCLDLGWLTEEDATYDKADALCVWAKAAADLDPTFAANFTPLSTVKPKRAVAPADVEF